MIKNQRTLNLYYRKNLVGKLSSSPSSVEFYFSYSKKWQLNGFSLSPKLPLSGNFTNQDVTYFFQNLLPEGDNLATISQWLNISKTEKFEVLRKIGSDLSGAFILSDENKIFNTQHADRQLTHQELSERLAVREQIPFSVWDQKIRVSSAGFQDKIGIKVINSKWFLPDGIDNHTSHILKPAPVNKPFESMVVNEFFCMKLSEQIKLPTAKTSLHLIPEPILLIERFDRILEKNGFYSKIHVIDGCQLLGLPENHKAERPYGSGSDVAHIREGASVAKLIKAIKAYSSTPIVDLKLFLNWLAFQLCIGNVDAHAKNISFFVDNVGKIKLAPFYDQICILDFEQLDQVNQPFTSLDIDLSMAIGDEFSLLKIGAYDIALMAQESEIPIKAVTSSFQKIAQTTLEELNNVKINDYYQRRMYIKRIITKLSLHLLKITSHAEQAYKDLQI